MKRIPESRIKALATEMQEMLYDLIAEYDDEFTEPNLGPEAPPVARPQVREERGAPPSQFVPPKSLAKTDQAKKDKNEL